MTEMTQEVGLSSNAAKRIAFLSQKETPGARLRVSVEGGGCSGFQYKFGFDANQTPDDKIVTTDGVEVLIDSMSYGLMQGSVIDYIETLGEAHFAIKNPNASATCGCGNSFAL